MSDNLPDELLIDTIATYESVTRDNAMLDFAYQLSTARFLGQFCKTEIELAHVHALADHPLPHMRRLGSLAFCFLPYCWYEKTLPLVQKNLSDPLKWIRYDSIRFFFFHACLDESVFELLREQNRNTDDADITKAINTTLTALTELRSSYALPFKSVQVGDFIVDIPETWLVEKDRHVHVFKSPQLHGLHLHDQQFISSLRLFVIPNLAADEIQEMPLFNMEAKLDDKTIIAAPTYITPTRYQATYSASADHRGITELTTTEFRVWDESSLLVANMISPLVHRQWVMERNLRILDSVRRA